MGTGAPGPGASGAVRPRVVASARAGASFCTDGVWTLRDLRRVVFSKVTVRSSRTWTGALASCSPPELSPECSGHLEPLGAMGPFLMLRCLAAGGAGRSGRDVLLATCLSVILSFWGSRRWARPTVVADDHFPVLLFSASPWESGVSVPCLVSPRLLFAVGFTGPAL